MSTPENPIPDFSELSDEEFMNLDPSTLGSEVPEGEDPEASAAGSEADSGAPIDSEESDPATLEEAGGAEPSTGTDEEETEEIDAAEEDRNDGTRDPYADAGSEAPEDDQSEDPADESLSATDDEPDAYDYEAAFKELMAPFRAARREVRLDNIEDARRLMQMGVDYSNKMRQMKPHLRILRTLDKAGLTDPEQVNFLIDLKNGNKDAIKKLLADGSIDPMDLDLEGSETYQPNEHVIGDVEMNLAEAFDSIQESPTYQKTLKVLDEMDTVSKQQLQGNPEVIPNLNNHIEAGIYDKVWAKVEMERMLGRLPGLSDLDAYYRVGEAMYEAGLLGPDANDATSSASGTPQDPAQGNGSPAERTAAKAKGKQRKAQKRAASPTKGRAAQSGPKVPDFSQMSDEEIEKLDISAYLN